MRTTYVAFGLQLHCSFALAGMTSRTAVGRPTVHLDLKSTAELDARWSGPSEKASWRGVLGDGHPLTIERGRERDLLFTYSDRARFRLDPSMTVLDCTPTEDGPHWQQVLLGRVLANVGLEWGHEALHASALDSPHGVLAVAAPSGTGKTTLATELMSRGMPLFADDVLTLTATADGVRAHPSPPLMNIGTGSAAGVDPDTLGRTLAVLGGERWMVARNATTAERPVRMICLFERGPGLTLEIRRLPSSPLPLAPYMLGLAGDEQRERSRFSLYADLMGAAELVKVTCGSDERPAAVADLLEDALRPVPALATHGGI